MAQNQGLINEAFAGEIPATKKVMINAVATGNAAKLMKSKFNAKATN